MTESLTPWWRAVNLRDEVKRGNGRIDDVQMSLHNAVFGRSSGGSVAYASAAYYGDITHPAASLVDLMAQVELRLAGFNPTSARAVWRLDQAMGGGKSHGLIGLWHLAEHPTAFHNTDLGETVHKAAEAISGPGTIPQDLSDPRCVVLDCDNPSPRVEVDGPAKTLGERFLWRLFEGANKKWLAYREHTASKAKLAEALEDVGRPVLILVDEIMDYIRWASNHDEVLTLGDMAFLRALLEAVKDVSNCVLVVVMIASDKDRMVVSKLGRDCREELEDLLIRNGRATPVSSGGDFAEIIRRRLFDRAPATEVVAATAALYMDRMQGSWAKEVFSRIAGSQGSFHDRLLRSYPFHPDLIDLAEKEWSLHAGFQRVRSTIQVFAATVYSLAEAGSTGGWVPPLIGPGDLPLSVRLVRDALLDSGLVTDQRTQSNLREISAAEISDPDHTTRGTARTLDLIRTDRGWNTRNPHAAERAATGMFVYSITPRPNAKRGATQSEIAACAFVPYTSFGPGDAEVVFAELLSQEHGLVAYDIAKGSGGQPPRYYFETQKTLAMHARAEREAITDSERDATVAQLAFELASTGPFARVINVEVNDPSLLRPGANDLVGLLEGAGLDDKHQNRLAVLDSRWFSLLNGVDSETRAAVRSAFGLGDLRLAVSWASSLVLACVNTQRRALARGLATEHLTWKRVSGLDTVKGSKELSEEAANRLKEADRRVRVAVKESYQHILYLADDGKGGREERFIRLQKENQSSLDGSVVWAALDDAGKAFGVGEFSATALIHNLRDDDWSKPLPEVRDLFWNSPRLPLLPGGDSDLRSAIYSAVQAGAARLVGSDGETRAVNAPADINLYTPGIRIEKTAPERHEDEITCPDLTAKSWAEASSIVQASGVILTGDASPGPITAQEPPPGQTVAVGSQVRVWIEAHHKDNVNEPSAEHLMSLSAVKSLRSDDAARNSMRNLLNALKNAVDDDASHIQIQVKVTASPESRDALIEAASEVGATMSVTDL